VAGAPGVTSPGGAPSDNDTNWGLIIQTTITALSQVYGAFAQNTMFVLQQRIEQLTNQQSCWSGKITAGMCVNCQTIVRNQMQAISNELQQTQTIFQSTGSNATSAAALLAKCVQTLGAMDNAVGQNL
jgi:hypothetical protein